MCTGGGGIGGAFATAAAEPQLPANQQTALRLACNAFQHPVLRQWVAAQVRTGTCLLVFDNSTHPAPFVELCLCIYRRDDDGGVWPLTQASGLLDGFASCLQSGSKAVRLGAATFLLNCAVLQGALRSLHASLQCCCRDERQQCCTPCA